MNMRKKRKLDPDKEKHWRAVMEKFRTSEMTFRDFCAAENISPNTFQFWRRELRLRDEAAGVVSSISKGENKPLQVEANFAAANGCELESTVLSPGDFVVTLSDGTAIKA